MKLLFPTDETFSKMFKFLLGFIDADFPFTKIKPDLRNVTTDIVEIIGEETYATLVTLFEEESTSHVLELAQYAIGLGAYRSFAPINDLQHGTNGRKMLSDTDSKTPFEHMLIKSDDELDKRYYKALDVFISYLDKNSDTWKASQEYLETHKLFVRTVKQFDTHYVIESRYLFLKLKPGLELAETKEIYSRVDSNILATIKNKLSQSNSSSLTAEEKILLIEIRRACVFYSLAYSIPRLNATLFPEGLLKKIRGERLTIKGRIAPQGNIVDQIAQLFSQDAAEALLQIEKLVTVNNTEESPTVIDPSCNPNDRFVST